MATCAGCGRKRGFFGVFTWQQCHRCDSNFCARCFGRLPDVETEQFEVIYRECGECGASIEGRETMYEDFHG